MYLLMCHRYMVHRRRGQSDLLHRRRYMVARGACARVTGLHAGVAFQNSAILERTDHAAE